MSPCTADDLENNFFEPSIKSKDAITLGWPHMMCIDQESEIKLRGSISTKNKFLNVSLSRCVGNLSKGTPCKSKDEIDALIDKSAMMFAYNSQTYIPQEYGDATVSNSLKIGFDPLDSSAGLIR